MKYQLTICRPVYIGTWVSDVQLCIDGLRFTAFVAVESEEPSATRRPGTGVYQSQGTIPHDSQHGLIAFLDECTRLWRHENITIKRKEDTLSQND